MSNSTHLPVGTKIRRLSDSCTGEVIETNEEEFAKLSDYGKIKWKPRRRIKWDHNKPRTWIAVTDLIATA